MKRIFIFLIIIVSVSCGGSKNPTTGIDLKFKLTEKQTLQMYIQSDVNMEMEMMGMKMPTTMKMDIESELVVEKINEKGNFMMNLFYKNIKMDGKTMNMAYSYDSKDGKVNGVQGEAMKQQMDELLKNSMNFELTPLGEIIQSKNDKNIQEYSAPIFAIYPGNVINIGDTWEKKVSSTVEKVNVDILWKYKLKEVKDNTAIIEANGEYMIPQNSSTNIKGKNVGFFEVDVLTGVQTKSELTQDVELTVNDMGMNMPIKLKSKMTFTIK